MRSGAGGFVRIVGGRWKRTRLAVVDVPGLRPTPDRVRETVFNWLSHALGGLDRRAVIDLYAGTGALGFEAASRGAAPVTLVERHPAVIAALRAQRDRLGGSTIDVVAGDALVVADRLARQSRRFDVVFLDPPFGQGTVDAALPRVAALCADDGLVYVEAERAMTPERAGAAGLSIHRADRAGDVFYHLLARTKTPHEEKET